ncbi:MAG: hypothetical protein JO057_05045 [Chloroflexi bacterium]|nr:hypothetical protein [Chloroflexota bacterium]
MSTNSTKPGERITPTYLSAAANPALANYSPAWLSNLADDVTLEGSMMNGAVQGPDAVRSLVAYVRKLYERQEFHYAGPVNGTRFLEDYTAWVGGEPVGNVVLITFNATGQTQHVVVNYRPRTKLLMLSRLVGEHFAGTPFAEAFASSAAE